MDTPDLTIPHPRMAERAFVLNPLAEIASGDLPHPLLEIPIGEMLNKVEDQRCIQLGTLDDVERKRS